MGSMMDRVRGRGNVGAGRLKQGLSRDTHDESLAADGARQELRGNAQRMIGEVKDAIGRTFHRLGSRVRRSGS